jgi:hypothetical protein
MASELEDADHQELTRLIIEIVWRIDHGKADTVADLFVDHGEMTLGTAHMAGREELLAWGRQRVDARYRTRHVCTNAHFVADGPDKAIGSTVLTVYLDDGESSSPTTPHTVGEYHDRFVRTDRGWRFLSRDVDQLFVRGPS